MLRAAKGRNVTVRERACGLGERKAIRPAAPHARSFTLAFPPVVGMILLVTAVLCMAQSQLRSITISTEPQAKVWIDGVLYGTTSDTGSLAIKTVSSGRKAVRVRADGFKEGQKVLLPTQSGPVSIPLTRTTDEAELAFQNAERLATVDREKAAAAYSRAIQLRPAYADAYIGLARVQLEAGDFEKAEKTIAAARRAKPGSAEISAVEGRILKSIDEEPRAIAAFKRATREGGGFQPEAYAGLGILYKEKAENFGASGDYGQEAANYAEAAKYLSTAIKQLSGAPDSVVIYQLLGLVYEQQKQTNKAIAVYQEFLKFFPGHPESEAFESFIVQLKKQAAEPK
jgi:Tfp pilus assembly protein PilF